MAADPDLIRRATLAIAATLQQLELDSGQLVESIALRRYDATTLDSVGPRHLMQVEIALVRIPGHDWLIP